MEQGKVVLDGTRTNCVTNEDVKEFYLGGRRRSAQEFQESEKFQAAQAMAVRIPLSPFLREGGRLR